jgi:Cation transporting ATPase, C-terminus
VTALAPLLITHICCVRSCSQPLSACNLHAPGDEPLISGLLWRNIIGQGVFQLGLMYALVTHGDAIFSVPAHASMDGPSVHYTIVFNVFVLLQLFNQVQPGSAYSQAVCYRSQRLQIGSIL